MVFRQLSLDGVVYEHHSQAEMIRRATDQSEAGNEKMKKEKEQLKKTLSNTGSSSNIFQFPDVHAYTDSGGNSPFGSPFGSPASQRRSRSAIQSPHQNRRQSATKSRRAPRGHHRRVISDTGSILGQLVQEDLQDIDFDHLQLESTVIPDHNLKEDLGEQLAVHSGKFEPVDDDGNYQPSICLDFFLSLGKSPLSGKIEKLESFIMESCFHHKFALMFSNFIQNFPARMNNFQLERLLVILIIVVTPSNLKLSDLLSYLVTLLS